jgi:hypothetical protein
MFVASLLPWHGSDTKAVTLLSFRRNDIAEVIGVGSAVPFNTKRSAISFWQQVLGS